MATDIEEFESAIMLVCSAYEDLKGIDPDNSLLSLIELQEVGFKITPQYREKYIKPHFKIPNGQLAFWDWIYPVQFEANLNGLLDYYSDLSAAIKNEISDGSLDRLVVQYAR